jgi:hypothetical protein
MYRAHRRVLLGVSLALASLLAAQTALAVPIPNDKRDAGLQNALDHLNQRARAYGLANHAPPSEPTDYTADNFDVLGHNSLGRRDTNADVWVHGDYAYVGTWAFPCTGRGVKVIDVSDLSAPRVVGAVAARMGTSAEDMVVRTVSTPHFQGDLLIAGIQRCGSQRALDRQQYGIEIWDVTNPRKPKKLSELATSNGGGGVHELDFVQRGSNVYAVLATPFSEWFDPVPQGDFRIADITNPRRPTQLAAWGAGAELGVPGPFWGLGSFGASFAHSARFSDDGNSVYVSYWDQNLLTFDVAGGKIAAPELVGQAQYPLGSDGDVHSVTPYGDFLLANDEDFDPRSPAFIHYGADEPGVASESPFVPPLWDAPGHAITADVFMADNQGCDASDYPADAAGKIAVLHTEFAFFSPYNAECGMYEQDLAADAAGVAAIVHAFVSPDTSPQWFDFSEASVPVLFTDPATATGMVDNGSATLEAQEPSWGYLRIYDAATGEQVAKFDDVFGMNDLDEAFNGFWSIHNTDVSGDRAYVSWYSNGIVALDLSPLNGATPSDPVQVGQFIPGGFPEVWGVMVRPGDGTIFASDMGSGLWIIRPTGDAAP